MNHNEISLELRTLRNCLRRHLRNAEDAGEDAVYDLDCNAIDAVTAAIGAVEKAALLLECEDEGAAR